MEKDEACAYIRNTITTQVLVRGNAEDISDSAGGLNKTGWLFDFRRVIMQGKMIEAIGSTFTATFSQLPNYQVCGLEVAAIPLVTGITQYRYSKGTPDANGFFIRKSRKKEGLLRMIEGTILKDVPIILVDDIMNQGKTFIRQIEVLEALGHKVHAVWTILRYRDESFYEYLHERNIEIHTLLTLDDLSGDTGIKNLLASKESPRMRNEYRALWKFSSERPNYFWVVPKSAPALSGGIIYFGADNGMFWAIRAHDGSTAWSYRVGLGSKGKSIFSSPVVYDGVVYFGAYDGNLYALDALTGKKKWVYFDADWIGSSPSLAPDLGLVFIGLEFGLFKKRGGVAAVRMSDGSKVWWDASSMPNFTHASPLYIQRSSTVAIGSNDGALRLYDARTGTQLWKTETGRPSEEQLLSGFSSFDIKGLPAYHATTHRLVVVNTDGDIVGISASDGRRVWSARMEFGAHGSPFIRGDYVYVGSLDKCVYCVHILTGMVTWRTRLSARIFATPFARDDALLIGCNDGKLYSLDFLTGVIRGYTTLTERITNAGVYDKETGKVYVTTYANELYALEKEPEKDSPLT